MRSRRGERASRKSYIFHPILIHCTMNSAKRTSPDLLVNNVLIDAMLGGTVVFAVAILRSRV